jgi:hypothetical protein
MIDDAESEALSPSSDRSAIGPVKTSGTRANPFGSGLGILSIGPFAGVVCYFFGSILPTLLGAPAVGG